MIPIYLERIARAGNKSVFLLTFQIFPKKNREGFSLVSGLGGKSLTGNHLSF